MFPDIGFVLGYYFFLTTSSYWCFGGGTGDTEGYLCQGGGWEVLSRVEQRQGNTRLRHVDCWPAISIALIDRSTACVVRIRSASCMRFRFSDGGLGSERGVFHQDRTFLP